MADNDKILELTEDLLGLAETPRKDFLKLAKHAHYLFNNNLDRWIPGTEDPLDINDGHIYLDDTYGMFWGHLLFAVQFDAL